MPKKGNRASAKKDKSVASGDLTRRSFIPWVLLTCIILFVILVRVRLLDFPLERDEGEYAYMGQLILQGIPPYDIAYNMKFPGTYLMYAIIMWLFGQTPTGIHIGLMIVNCGAILLVYVIGRKIFSDLGAIIASAAYALLSLSASVYGFAAHATHFVVLPALGGTLLMLKAVRKERLSLYLLSGALFSISCLMKQPGIFFALFGAAYIISDQLFRETDRPLTRVFLRKLGIFSLGAAVPILLTMLWLNVAGVFQRFWFWTVSYAAKYGSQVPLSDAWSIFRDNFPSVADGYFLIWILAALGLGALFFHRKLKTRKSFVLLFTLFSILTVCPGFYFREHYFVTLLPAIALLTGLFVDFLGSKGFAFLKPAWRYAGLAMFAAAAFVGIFGQREYLFEDSTLELSRSIYGPNPFPEALRIGEFIKSRSTATDKIAILGSEPEIFFYSGLHSATGYIYVYSLMENHEYALAMQKGMAKEIEASKPKFLIMVSVRYSWLVHPSSERFIFGWMDNYIRNNYHREGVADIIAPELTVYRWGDDARHYSVISSSYVLVFERNN
jgi:4-amino-4-deoxy-L-arabinose transferase-like glycosyltransferase